MCGISGIITETGQDDYSIRVMCDAMEHRGPDDVGIWIDERRHTVFMGHRRLSILDLSEAGHQPMVSTSGRYVLAFNGEIYNFKILKQVLENKIGPLSWRGHSDTEILLAFFEVFGIKNTLEQCHGMFAISVYDREKEELYLARDRMGEKPLYYGKIDGKFFFCSELKSLKAVVQKSLTIFKDALSLYIRHAYIPSPWSIYENVFKLQPGHLLIIDCKNIEYNVITPDSSLPFWNIYEKAKEGVTKFFKNDTDAIEALEMHLSKSIEEKMIADVPLGSFLSGGYDSSLVTALMQKQSLTPVKSFSIGFDVPGYNEAEHAKAVAKHLGTNHTEMYITHDDALSVIPKISQIYCEPFADSSQIPTYLVSKLTQKHVTVALSGDGGDELFGGYNRYFWTANIWNKLKLFPPVVRHLMSRCLTQLSPNTWNEILEFMMCFLPSKFHFRLPGDKLHKLAGIIESKNIDEIYYRLTSVIQCPTQLLNHAIEALSAHTDPKRASPSIRPVDRMMFTDMVSYLPDDILTKVDRASMSVSLETRVPFLDHSVVEFALHLPQHFKIRNGEGKWIIKELTHKYIPEALMKRPKMGFGVPIDEWLRGPLKEWASSMLAKDKLKQAGYFNVDNVQIMWNEHLSRHRNWAQQLWVLLMFQEWLDAQ